MPAQSKKEAKPRTITLEKEPLLYTLFVILNYKGFKEYIKKNQPMLYKRIYAYNNRKEDAKYTQGEIREFYKFLSQEEDYLTLNLIIHYNDEFSRTERPGVIGTFDSWYKIATTCVHAQQDEDKCDQTPQEEKDDDGYDNGWRK